MNFKCNICGVNDVISQGDVCSECRAQEDPYLASIRGTQPYDETTRNGVSSSSSVSSKSNRRILIGNNLNADTASKTSNSLHGVQNNSVSDYSTQQETVAPTNMSKSAFSSQKANATKKKSPISNGVTKNVTVDTNKTSAVNKWFRSLLEGLPFSWEDETTLFQVYPDFSGSSKNALGNACDQVAVYGKLDKGSICENNDIEVYGYRDSSNVVIAQSIYNLATGATYAPKHVVPALYVRLISIVLSLLVGYFIFSFGNFGVSDLVCTGASALGFAIACMLIWFLISKFIGGRIVQLAGPILLIAGIAYLPIAHKISLVLCSIVYLRVTKVI